MDGLTHHVAYQRPDEPSSRLGGPSPLINRQRRGTSLLIEASVDDMLADPIFHEIMRRDGVSADDIRTLMASLRRPVD